MRQVSDAFLLNVAEVSASLVGLFLAGIFSLSRRACIDHLDTRCSSSTFAPEHGSP